MDLHLSIKEIFTAFMVLFAVIDITGSTPIIINLNATGKQVQAGKAALISYAVMITFLFAGDALLPLKIISTASTSNTNAPAMAKEEMSTLKSCNRASPAKRKVIMTA